MINQSLNLTGREISFTDIIKIFMSYKLFIIFFVIISVLVTFVVTLNTPKEYAAKATILPLQGQGAVSGLFEALANVPFGK